MARAPRLRARRCERARAGVAESARLPRRTPNVRAGDGWGQLTGRGGRGRARWPRCAVRGGAAYRNIRAVSPPSSLGIVPLNELDIRFLMVRARERRASATRVCAVGTPDGCERARGRGGERSTAETDSKRPHGGGVGATDGTRNKGASPTAEMRSRATYSTVRAVSPSSSDGNGPLSPPDSRLRRGAQHGAGRGGARVSRSAARAASTVEWCAREQRARVRHARLLGRHARWMRARARERRRALGCRDRMDSRVQTSARGRGGGN